MAPADDPHTVTWRLLKENGTNYVVDAWYLSSNIWRQINGCEKYKDKVTKVVKNEGSK